MPLSVEQETSSPDTWVPIEATEIPSFLIGRYGPEARLVRIVPGEARILEAGALIFPDSDARHPHYSIGVILRHEPAGAIGLVAASAATIDYPVTVRENGQIVRAQIAALDA